MLARATWRALLLASMAGHLLSCVATSPAPARLGLRLAPATLGTTLSLQQHLSVEREGRLDALDTAVEIDAERLDLVGLTMGQRMLTLHFDGHSLQLWRHPLVPAQLRGEDILEDLQLTLWPVDVIEKALPHDWSIKETEQRRVLSLRGEPLMVIDYTGEPRWSGKIELTNLRYQYRITIQSVASVQ